MENQTVNNNGGTTDGLEPCTVIANAKYNGVKAITHFIHAGDKVISVYSSLQ